MLKDGGAEALERFTLDKAHRGKGQAFDGLPQAMDGHNPRMLQSTRNLGLTNQPAAALPGPCRP
jgi:hypothetical protein